MAYEPVQKIKNGDRDETLPVEPGDYSLLIIVQKFIFLKMFEDNLHQFATKVTLKI